MFRFNHIMRVLRDENNGDGNDLGIKSHGDEPMFAGADDDWGGDDSDLGMFDDNQDLSNLSDNHQGAIDEGALDDESGEEEEENSDEEEELSDDEDEEESEEEGDDSDDEPDEDLDEEDDNSDDEDDDSLDDDDDDSDSGDDADDADDASTNVEQLTSQFSELAKSSKTLSDNLANAQKAEFSKESFEKANADLIKKYRDKRKEYHAAIEDRDTDLMDTLADEVFDLQAEINTKQAAAASESGTKVGTARAALQAKMDEAIDMAAKMYEGLDSSSDKRNDTLIRIVNRTFSEKVKEGIPHVQAFVESVEEIAFTNKLPIRGEVPEEVREKTKEKRTKVAAKKRLKAVKKTPKRKAGKNNSGKINRTAFRSKTSKDFFQDDFVKSLGIQHEEF